VEKHCLCCGKLFSARNADQAYCSEIACQRKRKKKWQDQKLATDAAYKGNKADAQRRWNTNHPNYWRDYRERHPEYVARNRELQRNRNKLRDGLPSDGPLLQSPPMIAKMDATPSQKDVLPLISGTYRLIPFRVPLIAKMDAMIVELSVVSTG
jgi:hypothetical protein